MPNDGIPTDAVREWEAAVYEFLADDIPPAAMERGALVVADVVSAAVAGMAMDANHDAAVDTDFESGSATILGTARKVPVGDAALLNTTAAISQEIEEGHNTGGHVGASIIGGAIGVAEANDVSGEAFVEACVKAYELCTRIERSLFAMKSRLNEVSSWLLRNPHSTWTTVGPAIASALCLDASPAELRETFRTAANLAVVSMHDPYAEGPPARNFTAGFSAQTGVTAALTCQTGLRGSATALQRVYDPFDGTLDTEFTTSMGTLGDDWEITENYFKPYPSCRYTHAPLDALREIDQPLPDPATIDEVVVETYANGVDMAHQRPETPTAAKFSTPYVLARYLVSGAVDLGHFTPKAVRDPAVREVAGRVTLREDPEFEAAFPQKWGARVRVTAETGRRYVGTRTYPTGDYRDPLSAEAFWSRNHDLLAWGLDEERAAAAVQALRTVRDRPVATTVSRIG